MSLAASEQLERFDLADVIYVTEGATHPAGIWPGCAEPDGHWPAREADHRNG